MQASSVISRSPPKGTGRSAFPSIGYRAGRIREIATRRTTPQTRQRVNVATRRPRPQTRRRVSIATSSSQAWHPVSSF
jgi:hypothetical protein